MGLGSFIVLPPDAVARSHTTTQKMLSFDFSKRQVFDCAISISDSRCHGCSFPLHVGRLDTRETPKGRFHGPRQHTMQSGEEDIFGFPDRSPKMFDRPFCALGCVEQADQAICVRRDAQGFRQTWEVSLFDAHL